MQTTHRKLAFATLLTVLVLAANGVFAARSAHAAEAYLCENNRVVYVEVEDLERLIRTDACIARYHGIDLAAVSGDHEELARLTAPLSARSENPAANAPARMKPATPPEAHATLRPTQFVRAAARSARTPAVPPPVQAAPGTDYENVRIINAADEAGRWFRLPR